MSDTEAAMGVECDESERLDKLAEALAKAQVAMKHADPSREAGVTRDSNKKRKYATLADVMDAARPALSANGLSVVQHPSTGRGSIILTTWLLHESGQWMRSRLELPRHEASNMPIIWAMGTALSYARRYAYAAIVGVAVEDDDAQSAEVADEAHEEAKRERQSRGSAPTTFPPFGKAKGAPISGASVEHLEWYLARARESLADPDKAKWHARESALIGAIEAELGRQRKTAPEEAVARKEVVTAAMAMSPQEAGVYYAQLVQAAKDAGQPDVMWKTWLRGNGLAKQQQVTAEHLARFKERLVEIARRDDDPIAGDGPGPGREPEDDAPF
jgi:hypothetical protein